MKKTGKLCPKKPHRGFVRYFTRSKEREHTVKTKTITLLHPEQILKAAASLSGFIIRSVYLDMTTYNTDGDTSAGITLHHGVENGISYVTEITLGAGDINPMQAYLEATQDEAVSQLSVMVRRFADTDDEGDGGEVLPVPTVSERSLEQMMPVAGRH